jgi:hypothetical protein
MVLSASDGACTRLPLRLKGWQPGGDWVSIMTGADSDDKFYCHDDDDFCDIITSNYPILSLYLCHDHDYHGDDDLYIYICICCLQISEAFQHFSTHSYCKNP